MSRNNVFEKVVIIDFGSQFTQLIARKVRELGVYSEIVNFNQIRSLKKNKSIKGIILSGGPLTTTNKNSLDISSLNVPNIFSSETWIGFINHFLIKRGYRSIALKISAINKIGYLLDTLTIEINEPKVYSFNLTKMFTKFNSANYLIEFFSEKNLFIPFPAVIINHFGKDFCNVVHSYNRILNDIFENDQINKTQVSEASFDLNINSKYDTFFKLRSF